MGGRRKPVDLFFQEKPVKAMLVMKEKREGTYQTVVAKQIDTTYAHALRILGELERLRLIQAEQMGRVKQVKLTPLGEEMARILEWAERVLEVAEIADRIEEIYKKEIKGKLREEIRKERVKKEYERLKAELEKYSEEKGLGVITTRLKVRIDECLAEALGLPLESTI